MSLTWHVGDTRKVLAIMPPRSVDLVLSSPPFLALRSYLPVDHADKASEMGSEPTPGEFIDTLLDVVEACERVLAPHGSLCFELGDTYSGSGGAGGDYGEGGMRDGQPMFRQGYLRNDRDSRVPQVAPKAAAPPRGGAHRALTDNGGGHHFGGDGWPEAKSLCLIPESFRWALVYGRNPFTGRETPRWRVRNVVRWVRPNPPVGALGDKFRPATSEMVVVCKDRSRYFDLDAVRVPFTGHAGVGTGVRKGQNGSKPEDGRPDDMPTRRNTHDGAPPLDWWQIPTQGYPGSHYATWPKALLLRPIKAMCPERVCLTCGEPSRPIVDVERVAAADDRQRVTKASEYRLNDHDHPPEVGWQMRHTTTGWTDCGHDDWRPGVVLDPFMGSGTTMDVAHGLGRDAIGIDLDPRNVDLAQDRLGMFPIDVVDHRVAP